MKQSSYLLLFLAISLVSCEFFLGEPFLQCDLCNETKDSILLKLELDTAFTKEYRQDLALKEFLKFSVYDSAIIDQKIDTLRYIGEYLIKPKSCLEMDGGINPRPSMYFSKMKIYHNGDSVVVIGRESINKTFKKTEGQNPYAFKFVVK